MGVTAYNFTDVGRIAGGYLLFIDAGDGQLKVVDGLGNVSLFSDIYSGNGGGGGGTAVIEETFTVAQTLVGGYSAGMQVASGTTLTQFAEQLLIGNIPATLTISASLASTVQVNTAGTTNVITKTYNQGTQGALTAFTLQRDLNGGGYSAIASGTAPTSFNDTTFGVTLGAYRYRGVWSNGSQTNVNSAVISNTAIYPYYSGFLVGATKPTTAQIASYIQTGSLPSGYSSGSNTQTVANSFGTVTGQFNNGTGWMFLAIPAQSVNSNAVVSTPVRTRWTDTTNSANTETIPGSLFNSATTQNVTSPTGNWSGVSYLIYIGNYITQAEDYTFTT
jgi:hypothetical protein